MPIDINDIAWMETHTHDYQSLYEMIKARGQNCSKCKPFIILGQIKSWEGRLFKLNPFIFADHDRQKMPAVMTFDEFKDYVQQNHPQHFDKFKDFDTEEYLYQSIEKSILPPPHIKCAARDNCCTKEGFRHESKDWTVENIYAVEAREEHITIDLGTHQGKTIGEFLTDLRAHPYAHFLTPMYISTENETEEWLNDPNYFVIKKFANSTNPSTKFIDEDYVIQPGDYLYVTKQEFYHRWCKEYPSWPDLMFELLSLIDANFIKKIARHSKDVALVLSKHLFNSLMAKIFKKK